MSFEKRNQSTVNRRNNDVLGGWDKGRRIVRVHSYRIHDGQEINRRGTVRKSVVLDCGHSGASGIRVSTCETENGCFRVMIGTLKAIDADRSPHVPYLRQLDV
jgi:hypothetical protein